MVDEDKKGKVKAAITVADKKNLLPVIRKKLLGTLKLNLETSQ